MATLIFEQDGREQRVSLTQERVLVGRHRDCDIVFSEPLVSKKHLEIRQIGDGFVATDLNSRNGSYLNGKRIDGDYTLWNNDCIRLAHSIRLRFESDEPGHQRAYGDIDVEFEDDSSSIIVKTLDSSSSRSDLTSQPAVKLKAVIEISRSLAGAIELEKLLPKLLDSLFRIFLAADRGCILLKNSKTGELLPAGQKLRRAGDDQTVRLSRTVIQKVVEERAGILSYDALNDSDIPESESIAQIEIRSMMCVPLLSRRGDILGLIHIDTTQHGKHFEQDDLDLLLAIAGQAAVSIESMRLMKTYVLKQKQDREILIAAQVQNDLLPQQLPQCDGYDFFASYHAAQKIGGDYYDAIVLPDNRVWLAFGDVAGKGVPAALIASRLASCVQTTVNFAEDVCSAMESINRHMASTAVEGRFSTLVLILIDPHKHEMTFANAGALPLLIRRADGTVEEFDEAYSGLLIGVDEDYRYRSFHRQLEPGEIVLLRTDGVDDAMSLSADLYTAGRVRSFLQHFQGDAVELGEALLTDVAQHAGARSQSDDITLMTFGRRPQ